MILAAAIGWALTFCLIWEEHTTNQIGSSVNPNAAVHSVQVVIPHDANQPTKIDPTYDRYLVSTSATTVSTASPTTSTSGSDGKKKKKSKNHSKTTAKGRDRKKRKE